MPATKFPSDSLIAALEKNVENLNEKLSSIASNTDSFSTWFTSLFTILSFVATLVTICGITALIADYIRKRMSTKKQIRIILDLMRHFMENDAILEVIIQEKKNKRYPIEGTLSRFATLDDDTDLGKLSVSAEQYERLHNLSLSIRNYNSIVSHVDKHITDPSYPDSLLDLELFNIKDRANHIRDSLFTVSEKLHKDGKVTEEEFANYIERRYENETCEIESKIKKGMLESYIIPHKINGDYYENFGLTRYYEARITKQARQNLIFHKRARGKMNSSAMHRYCRISVDRVF